MAAAEVLALVGLLFGGAVGVKALYAWLGRAKTHDAARILRADRMRDDLRVALASHDHRKIDDFIAMWGDEITGKAMKHIQQRRDELYIESDAIQ